MSGNHRRGGTSQRGLPEKKWPEKMKLSEACKFLGVSVSKMTTLVSSGRIAVDDDPLDRRVRLVRRSDLEKLLRKRTLTDT
jgi:predicted site-specific integrase-resolvase